jgi:threonine aldolase
VIPIARDLRSDALTQPTDAMWQAMRRHAPGWAPFGDDPAVIELEERGAALTGKEAALLVATGAAANLVALLTHTRPGDVLVADAAAHVVRAEYAGYAALGGLSVCAASSRDGHLAARAVRAAFVPRSDGRTQRIGLVWFEVTHGAAGGTVPHADELHGAARSAREAGAPTHVDGARLANAAIATGVPVAALAAAGDSVTFNLNKGLGAPMGALLCGDATFVAAAREVLGRIGGASIHQAGIWAAAALLAIEPSTIDRLADDHVVAHRLAAGLAQIDGITVRRVETNIVLADLSEPYGDAPALAAALRRAGCGAHVTGPRQLRFVTHRHIGRADADAVVETLAATAGAS